MLSEVREILRNDVEVVIKSPQLSLSLLRCYSLMYLHGAKPGVCARSQRNYYQQLKKDGIMRAEKAEDIKKRTCKPNWKGVMWVRKAAVHYSDETITDNEAINGLQRGYLSESNFTILPVGYKKNEIKVEPFEEESLIEEIKPVVSVKKAGRKPKA